MGEEGAAHPVKERQSQAKTHLITFTLRFDPIMAEFLALKVDVSLFRLL